MQLYDIIYSMSYIVCRMTMTGLTNQDTILYNVVYIYQKEGTEVGKTSDAQLAATKRWNKKQYRMTLRISPELKAELDQYASLKGISATKFIERAIKEKIARENLCRIFEVTE